MKFGNKKLGTSLYRMVRHLFRYLESRKMWLTNVEDRRADRQNHL